MDARVPATIALHLAKAHLRAAELERLKQSTPCLHSNSNQRIVIARKLKAAREHSESWQTVLRLVDCELRMGAEERDGLDKEFKAAPGRIVAQREYVADGPDRLYCNRVLCYSLARKGVTLVPITSADLPDGSFCSHCGTDVLA